MFRDFIQRRRLRRVFTKYLPAAVVDTILSDRASPSNREFQDRSIEVVLVMVRGDTPALVSERMGGVAALAAENNGIVNCMVSALVVVVFGALPVKGSAPGDAQMFIRAVRQELGGDVKMVYTVGSAQIGNFGGESRMAYTFLFPEFCVALSAICTLPFGEAHEV